MVALSRGPWVPLFIDLGRHLLIHVAVLESFVKRCLYHRLIWKRLSPVAGDSVELFQFSVLRVPCSLSLVFTTLDLADRSYKHLTVSVLLSILSLLTSHSGTFP